MNFEGGVRTEAGGRALAESVRHALELARLRTLELLSAWPLELLTAQFTPLLSPLVWDLAHLANYEEQWLVRALGGQRVLGEEKEALYDAANNPRHTRGALPLLSLLQALEYAAAVRRKALELLDAQRFDEKTGLSAGGFVYGMVLQHEHQHAETMLAAIQASELPYPEAPALRTRLLHAHDSRMIFHEGGALVMGSRHPFAYDNERPTHAVVVKPYLLDAYPATNAQFIRFIDAGGYKDSRLWSPEGLQFAQSEQLERPLYWVRSSDGQYFRTRFGHFEPLPLHEPVQHISFYEAEAFARFCGKRLPTEAEWERAAQTASTSSANLWHDGLPHAFAPMPAGSITESASSLGVEQLFGDVWEWCSSSFEAYPGFRAYPYGEYSQSFFGEESRVLRGGSWATHPSAMRASFRNWDFPTRRHLFAGVRCAADV